jgi:hypothetical protein
MKKVEEKKNIVVKAEDMQTIVKYLTSFGFDGLNTEKAVKAAQEKTTALLNEHTEAKADTTEDSDILFFLAEILPEDETSLYDLTKNPTHIALVAQTFGQYADELEKKYKAVYVKNLKAKQAKAEEAKALRIKAINEKLAGFKDAIEVLNLQIVDLAKNGKFEEILPVTKKLEDIMSQEKAFRQENEPASIRRKTVNAYDAKTLPLVDGIYVVEHGVMFAVVSTNIAEKILDIVLIDTPVEETEAMEAKAA